MADEGNQGTGDNGQSTGQNQSVLTGETNQNTNTNTNTNENKGAADWRDSLPADLKGAKSLASIKSVEDLAKGYVNAQSVIGKRFEDLTPEQLNLYYNKMGRPEKIEDYGIKAPTDADPMLTDWYLKTAHEIGLPKEMASKMFEKYSELLTEQTNNAKASVQVQMDKDFKQLKADFGPEFESRCELANRALTEFGGEELVNTLAQYGLQNSPVLVKAFAKAGMMLAEGKFVEGNSTGKFGTTAEEAANQIAALRKDPEFMKHYMNAGSSKHKEAVEKIEKLYEIKSYAERRAASN